MTASLTVIGSLVVSVLIGAGQGQLPLIEVPPEVLELVVRYRQLIEKYRHGDPDSVDAVIALPPDHLESILRVIFAIPDQPWAQQGELRAASMLHTDAALRNVEHGDRRRHLNVAGRMLHASGVRDDPFVPRWYYAVSRALRERVAFSVAQDLLERGRAQVPGNPTILYESANVAETLSRGYSLGVTERVSGIRSIDPDTGHNLQRRARLLNDAARWLREALERDESMLIARLHLGRVETLRSREKDGLVHLERVFSATTDEATGYLAALFTAAAHERMGRLDAAQASYRQAIARFPAGQAAYVALSELLQRAGQVDESRAMLNTLLAGRTESTREPWWWYLADPPGVADERLDALRREVRR
jgi:tetratricopeptide (TPR) repeat protein